VKSLVVNFESIFRVSPNPYMLLDRELRFVAVNEAYLRVTSSRFDDIVGRNLFEVFPNDPGDPANESSALLRESLLKVLETKAVDVLAFIPYAITVERDGETVNEERFWSATHTPILDDTGEVAFILQHTVDVTELHRLKQRAAEPRVRTGASAQVEAPVPSVVEAGVLERAQQVQEVNLSLDAERRYLRRLFEQAPGFICSLRGPDHVFELANDAYSQLIGHRDIIGKAVREALPELAGQGWLELLDRVYTSGEPYVGHGVPALLQRQPGGALDEVRVDIVYQPVFDMSGGVTGIFVQGQEVTEQHRLQSELERLLERERTVRAEAEAARSEAERANRLKDEFLATLSHELRTPLNALVGWARLLRTRALNDDMRERAGEVIERNAMLQAQLVEDILDVSRIITGKLRLRVRRIDFGHVLDSALEIVAPAAEAKGVRIERTGTQPIRLWADAERLQQVAWNLLSNAVKFTPGGGSVRVNLTQTGTGIILTVQDTGAGIAPEFLPHVFERFRQGAPGPERGHGGLGLGLAVVKHVVEAHGGEVRAFSDGPGTGATFVVRLPIGAADDTDDERNGVATRSVVPD
jgi:PAS domain S-box-containing protein